MKKTSSIRLFFILCTFGCCAAYCGGYYYSVHQSDKINEKQLADAAEQEQEAKPDTEEIASLQSAAVLTPYEFILFESEGYVVVYRSDKTTLYAETDIRMELLSEDLQTEIEQGKPIYSEAELYNFLESHSS